MCGIVGYIGKKNAVPIVLDGLKRLEYRGYDSAGIAAFVSARNKAATFLKREKGRIAALEEKIGRAPEASCAIGHTRWATHGVPSVKNAHPHYGCAKRIFAVHNGIIENHAFLREKLEGEGHRFTSDTDSEVLVHLVERSLKDNGGTLADAVREALGFLRGTFGVAVIDKQSPNTLIAARRGSPLLVGIGNNEYFIASDAAALVAHTRKVVYLQDDEMAELSPEGYFICTISNTPVSKDVATIEWDIEQSKKSGFPHFMLKEIHEAPDVIRATIGGRAREKKEGEVKLGGLDPVAGAVRKIRRILIVACGTSYYAALAGKTLFREYAHLPVEVEYASEFRYNAPPIDKDTAVIAISQSGETADTLEAIREAKRKGALTLGIVNVVGSSIAREVDAGVYNHAGPEIAVASTKAFLSQITVLALMAVFFGRQRQLTADEARSILESLDDLPEQAASILNQKTAIRRIARKYARFSNLLYLGRKYSFPVALEGALKLKEISYIHAEGYPAGEMKHGPLAVIDGAFPTVAIALSDSVYEKMLSNMQEIRARGGKIIAVATEGNKDIRRYADDVLFVPEIKEALSPLLSVIPLQLFAYYAAVVRGKDVDKPRNLAKSVTVE